MRKRVLAKRIGIGVVSAAMALSLVPASAFAVDTTGDATEALMQQVLKDSADTSDSYDYLTTQTKSGLSAQSASELPEKVDLRESGKVTPVKFQNPWGTCWAFGITAAAETSILSELGTTYEESQLDLSEHHLSWFAKNHIADEGEDGYNATNAQAGEGLWYSTEADDDDDDDDDGNLAESADDEEDYSASNASMEGGMPYYGAYTYAAGMGVALESRFPYQGKNKWVQVRKDGERVDLRMTYDEAIAAGYTASEIRNYSKLDDWSIPESSRFVQTYALEESNILPSITPEVDEETGDYVLNEDGVNAVKSELAQGRAVNVGYCADSSDPNKEFPASSTSRYMNKTDDDEWAQFTWSADGQQVSANHSVTIVGYDDNYSKDNFTQAINPVKWDENENVIYKLADGTELENDKYGNPLDPDTGEILDKDTLEIAREETNLTTPAGDGAWIVKNSWGAADNDFPNSNGGNKWGTNGTGYFYLSYYDMSACCCETFDFATTSQEKSEYDYTLCYEYDFMPTSSTMSSSTLYTVSMANVFTADRSSRVSDVSCQTSAPGTHVEYQVYLIDDETQDPTDGELVSVASADYTYGGFHRAKLDTPVCVQDGQRFSVVVTESVGDEGLEYYTLNFNRGSNEIYSLLSGAKSWVKGVVNKGESYLGVQEDDGSMAWTDWSNFTEGLQAANVNNSMLYDYDNFCIKAYADQVSDVISTQPQSTSAVNGAAVNLSVGTNDAKATYQWQYSKDGITWTNSTLASAKSGKLSFKMAPAYDGRKWRCVVTFSDGVVIDSKAATTTLKAFKSIANTKIVLGSSSFTYNGKAKKPAVKSVTLGDGTVLRASDYKVAYRANVNAGTAKVVVTGTGSYKGTVTKTFTIKKAVQPVRKATRSKTLAAGKTKSFKVKLAGVKGGATVKYSAKAAKYFTVTVKGKVTVKKGLKKGVYTLKIKCAVAATKNYKAATRYLTYKIKIK